MSLRWHAPGRSRRRRDDADADDGDDAFPGLEPCGTARAKAARAELAGRGKLS